MEMVCIHLYFPVAANMLYRVVSLAVREVCRITAHGESANHGPRSPQI